MFFFIYIDDRITFSSGDASSEALCDAWGPSSVYNPGPMGIGCYWAFPDEESGKGRELGPGEFARYNLHATEGDTRWSGTIWASTGCDKVDGCATGVCYSPDTNYVCPAYVGPGGPTTKAEFTLSDGGKDYYDVSMIDGINLPMQIEPDNPHLPESVENNHMKVSLCLRLERLVLNRGMLHQQMSLLLFSFCLSAAHG